jgi:hypothetical protein
MILMLMYIYIYIEDVQFVKILQSLPSLTLKELFVDYFIGTSPHLTSPHLIVIPTF